MRIGNEHIVQLLLAGIIGVGSMGVSKMGDISDRLRSIEMTSNSMRVEMNIRNQENQIRDEKTASSLKEIDSRLRLVERETNVTRR